MNRKMLRDDQWARIEQLLPGKASDPGCTVRDNRLFVEAVLWILRTGSPWQDLPCELGNWHSTYVRFARWRDSHVWERVAEVLGGDADMEQLFIDSTIVRAHQHSAGAKKSRQSGNRPLARRIDDQIARCRRCAGQSAARLLSAGQVADIDCASALIKNMPCQAVVADKGYDADHFVARIESAGAEAVIPPRSNRLTPRVLDRHLYHARGLIERFFARLKHFRRIATRYGKLAKSFLTFVHLACAFIWLA